jgi:hypothetical protein
MSAAKPATTCPDCATQRKLARKYKRALQELTAAVPEGRGRGRLIANVANGLEMANDQVRYFTLGVDWRRDVKTRAKQEREVGP